jgi:DNA-binding PadR family transcriptional regulator
MAVREGLLALLDEGKRYGYQLKTEFEHVTGGVWPLNVGQVYTTLDRLERDGLVAVAEEHGQKSYEITAAGREELGAWWDAVPLEDPPPRDELMLKVLMAIEHGPEHALAVLTRQRTALLALLQLRRRESRARTTTAGHRPDPGRTESESDAGPNRRDSLASLLVADALVVRAEADLRWLDLCESRLVAAATPPSGKDRS